MPDAMFVVRLLLALTCVVGLIWYLGRRLGNGGPQQQRRASREPGVKLVGRQSMSRHTGVAVVAVGQRRILVGYGEQQVTMLTELAPVFDELPQATCAPTDSVPAAGATAPWVSVARATRAAAASVLPTQRSRRSATPGVLTPASLVAAGVPTPAPAARPAAPKVLDASPLDRLDQADWPTHDDIAPEAGTAPEPAPAASDSSKGSALAGSILAPDTWRQAVRSLQDRSVRR